MLRKGQVYGQRLTDKHADGHKNRDIQTEESDAHRHYRGKVGWAEI